jgi:addiction module RelE/StbE family toxin
MRKLYFHKRFWKEYRKLRAGEKRRCKERLRFFQENLTDPILDDHALAGQLSGYRSINIGGDLRAQYELLDEEGECVHFVRLGTHSELYSK